MKREIETQLYLGILIPHSEQWIDFPNKISTRIWWHSECPTSNGLNSYIYNLSSQGLKIHILFKCIWDIFKDKTNDRTQNKPQQIQGN